MTLEPVVTWVTVERPSFDLVGVVLGSFRAAGALIVVAVGLGLVFGTLLILGRRRTAAAAPLQDVSLHLDPRA
jgi:hypothetical protein